MSPSTTNAFRGTDRSPLKLWQTCVHHRCLIMLDANDVTMSEGDQDDASHSFHYIFAPYASAYATRLTKYTHAADASNAVIIISEDGSGEAVECCRTRCSVILEMDDLTEALLTFTSLCACLRFGPTELALHLLRT
jgi:hypothetical protein